MSTLGERLRKARKRCGMSQMDVYDAVGISNKSLSRYEKDVSSPSPGTLMKLVRLYDVSSEYILGTSSDMGNSPDKADGETLISMTDHRASAEKLINFIASSPTAFHVVDNISRTLLNEGFTKLNEWEAWDIKPGGKYFTQRNGSSLIAFKVGGGNVKGFNIYAAHSDSPSFKLKPSAELNSDGYVKLDVERYGGAVLGSWFDRPLSVAGRVAVNDGGELKSVLVNLSDITVLIPSVAPHIRRGNDSIGTNLQIDLLPTYTSSDKKESLMSKIAAAAGVKEKDVIGTDLFLYNREAGTVWGGDGEFVSSPKLDDLQCVYAGYQGFLKGGSEDNISALCILDNEEVGSSTKQGANSDFLADAVERICRALSKTKSELMPCSFVISADNAQSVHPNHPELYDPLNRVYMNGGIVLKYNAAQKYATDGVSGAIFKKICAAVAVPVQSYSNRSDIPGGGTLGNISATRLSVNTADIGLAQLAMHSSYETAGSMDTLYLERVVSEFFRTKIVRSDDGGYAVGSEG